MLENNYVGRDYVEPYAGGASVALSLLYEGFADSIHINDINPGVYAFWDAAVNSTSELCDRISGTDVTIEEWRRQRAVAADSSSSSFDLAFATFFLNRTNRSGIIGGGVIGGLNQDGPWKLDARYTKPELIRRIQKVGRHRTRINLTRLDAVDFLQTWSSPGAADAFIYLDPPYFVKGSGLYDNFYSPEDHEHVAAAVNALQHPWIVSYDAHPDIIGLYSQHMQIRYALSYSANTSRQSGSEVMVFSEDVIRPDVLPSGIPAAFVARAQARIAKSGTAS